MCNNNSWKIWTQTSGEWGFCKFARARTGGGDGLKDFGGRPL